MSNIPFFEMNSVRKEYINPSKIVLDGISMSFSQGDFVCVLGPSGCGKSTLLRCISGLENYEGEIKLNGNRIMPGNKDCFMVFQDMNQLFPWLKAGENLTYALKTMGIKSKKERENIANQYLEKVQLLPYKNYYPSQLSGGMKQRVAIARALALHPKLILMDEPFAALDAITRNQMEHELTEIADREGSTIFFVTHNIQEAIILGNRILVLSRTGKILVDIENNLEKPIFPSSKGYGELWEKLNDALVLREE